MVKTIKKCLWATLNLFIQFMHIKYEPFFSCVASDVCFFERIFFFVIIQNRIVTWNWCGWWLSIYVILHTCFFFGNWKFFRVFLRLYANSLIICLTALQKCSYCEHQREKSSSYMIIIQPATSCWFLLFL